MLRNKNIFIALTYDCCAFCKKCMTRYHQNRKIKMSRETLERIVKLLKENNYKGTISVGTGEPLLYPDIEYFIKNILSINDSIKIRLLTNGMLLNNKIPNIFFDKRIIWGITLDGFNQETIEEYQKGVNINIVRKNIENIVKIYGADSIYLNYTIYQNNIDEILPFCEFAVNNNIKEIYFTKLKVFQGYENRLEKHRIIENNDFFSKIDQVKKFLQVNNISLKGIDIKDEVRNECFKKNLASPIIDVTGQVTFCSGKEDIYIGNICDEDILIKWSKFYKIVNDSNGKWCKNCFDKKLQNGNYRLPKTIEGDELL